MGKQLAVNEAKAALIRQIDANLPTWLDMLETKGLDTSIPMGSPLDEKSKISSGWGPRDADKIKTLKGRASSMHRAIDFNTVESSVGRNVAVKALVDAVVLGIGDPEDGSGNCVFYGGMDGVIYAVAHTKENSAKVRVGQKVSRDQALAIMGQTGTAEADCAHMTAYHLPFVAKGFTHPDFKDWTWQNRSGFFKDHVTPQAFAKGLREAEERDSNGRLTWSDIQKGRDIVVTGYPDPEKSPKAQMAKGTRLPQNDERDRYPHVYAMETYLKKHAPTPELAAFMQTWELTLVNRGTPEKPRMRIEELHPNNTKPSAWLKQLDEAVYAFSRTHDAPRHPHPVKEAPGKTTPEVEKSVWEKAMEVACDWTGFGCSAQASITPPGPGMSRSTAARSINVPIHDRSR